MNRNRERERNETDGERCVKVEWMELQRKRVVRKKKKEMAGDAKAGRGNRVGGGRKVVEGRGCGIGGAVEASALCKNDEVGVPVLCDGVPSFAKVKKGGRESREEKDWE